VDVGGFAEPRKILCQCALPSYEQISVHPRSDFPNTTMMENSTEVVMREIKDSLVVLIIEDVGNFIIECFRCWTVCQAGKD